VLNVLSTAGATILGVGYLLPMVFPLSMRYGKPAPDNPWNQPTQWQPLRRRLLSISTKSRS